MRIIQCHSTQEAVQTVADLTLERLLSRPSSVIGLATGRTMEGVYAAWTKRALGEGIDHSSCFFFMLDEYLGLPDGHRCSFKSYIQERLLRPLSLREDQIAFPPVHGTSHADSAKHYEISIQESGGVDLQLLGIGQNGHIGFNEPGSAGNSRTRVVELTESTINANKSEFGEEKMPTQALSMGIGTILEAKNLLMLATGKSKAEVIKYLLNHHDDPNCPATFLKSHPHFTLVLDPDAGSKINLNI